MRRRAPGRPAGPAELEALDPLTGESLFAEPASSTTTASHGRIVRRTRRLRRIRVVCALLAVACASTAAYFGISIAQLRSLERTWRTAMALDRARADADRQVRDVLEEVSSGDDEVGVHLDAIGNEAASGLRLHERDLAERWIFDSKVSDLRDAMVEALEFRRFQLTPDRNRMGDTPLQLVETTIDVQLARWDLSPSRVPSPELHSLPRALQRLRSFADVKTSTILFALDGTTLLVVDIDKSRTSTRQVSMGGVLLPVKGGVAVADGSSVVIYPVDVKADPVAVIDQPGGNLAFAAGDASGGLWIVQDSGTAVRRYRVDGAASGWVGESVPLPARRVVVGATNDHLVVGDLEGRLELFSPSERRITAELATEGARFLAARGNVVLWQGPLPLSPRDSSDFLHRFDVGTARRDLIGLPRTDAASAAVSATGIAAISAGPLAGRLGSILVLEPDSVALTGSDGPRASVGPSTIAWAPDGNSVFWLTPDGALAIGYGTRPATRQRLRTGLTGLDSIAVLER